jgi:hypothetical protein
MCWLAIAAGAIQTRTSSLSLSRKNAGNSGRIALARNSSAARHFVSLCSLLAQSGNSLKKPGGADLILGGT